ncbi:hypothetical protein PMIN03_005648 [Paraphaeosphaeria minitans]
MSPPPPGEPPHQSRPPKPLALCNTYRTLSDDDDDDDDSSTFTHQSGLGFLLSSLPPCRTRSPSCPRPSSLEHADQQKPIIDAIELADPCDGPKPLRGPG